MATAYRLAPELEMKVHTQRASRLLGRAVEGEGAVYRYESLARWQCFEAVILCDEPGVVATLRGLLPGPHRLGSALTGGYGEVEIDTLREPEKWRECGGELNAPEDGAFTLTLLSDAIVRDESGQHAATVGALLHGLRACIPNGTLSDEDAFLRPEVVGGFNRRWGLPVPQVQALKMGSVFRLRVAGLTTQGLKAVLEELEAQGIGERRAEGYGRVAVNWHAEEAKWAVSDAESPRPRPGPPPDIQLSGRDETLAGDMVKRVLGERLDRHLAARAAKINILNPPKRSQLARLRTVMRAELTKDSPDPACIREFVADVCSRQSTRAQFQNARVTGQRHVPLHEWLENAADSTGEGEWRRFVDPELQILPIRIGQIEAKVDADLRKRYLLRLVDAALSRAMKKQAGTEDG
ncbi:MAG: hypothetical protein ACREXU_06230 [Gammaproteobacteria bacterium]